MRHKQSMVEHVENAAGGSVAGPRLSCEKTEMRTATRRRRNKTERNAKVRTARDVEDGMQDS